MAVGSVRAQAVAPAQASSTQASPQSRPVLDVAADGTVRLEKAGKNVGLGFVLRGDGRIVTSLANVGDGNQLAVRYVNSAPVAVKVGHTDRKLNLALLVPQTGKWADGLRPSALNPIAQAGQLNMFVRRGNGVAPSQIAVKGAMNAVGGDGASLQGMYEFDKQVVPGSLGAPVVDDRGAVVAIVTRGCKAEAKGCQPVTFGVPIGVIREFLRAAPASSAIPSPWLGVQAVRVTRKVAGVRVTQVHQGGSADVVASGSSAPGALQANDVIMAMDGAMVDSVDKLAQLVRDRAVGDTVQLIVARGSKYVVMPVVLQASPSGATVVETPSAKPQQ